MDIYLIKLEYFSKRVTQRPMNMKSDQYMIHTHTHTHTHNISLFKSHFYRNGVSISQDSLVNKQLKRTAFICNVHIL